MVSFQCMVLVWDMGMRLWSLPAACPTMELVGRVSWLYWTAWSTVTTSRSSCKLTLQRPGVYVQTCVWGFGAKTSHSSACIYVASFPDSTTHRSIALKFLCVGAWEWGVVDLYWFLKQLYNQFTKPRLILTLMYTHWFSTSSVCTHPGVCKHFL